MSTLLEKPIKVNRTITTSIHHARAIEDPARAKMLEILYRRELNVEQISKELQKTKYKKAPTTVRHHLEILKNAGLIEVVKIQETRGAITKFYSTSAHLLDYKFPEDFDSKYSSQIESAESKMEKILSSITPKTKKGKKSTVSSEGYSQYLMLEIMNRAVTNILEKPKHPQGAR